MAWDPRAAHGCSMAAVWARVPRSVPGLRLLSGCAWPRCSPEPWSQLQTQGLLRGWCCQLCTGLAGVSHVPRSCR